MFKQLKNRKGMSVINTVQYIGVALLGTAFLAYILSILDSAITNTAFNGIINNTLTMFTNFTANLDDVGTIAGAALIIFVVAGIGLLGYNSGKGRGWF